MATLVIQIFVTSVDCKIKSIIRVICPSPGLENADDPYRGGGILVEELRSRVM